MAWNKWLFKCALQHSGLVIAPCAGLREHGGDCDAEDENTSGQQQCDAHRLSERLMKELGLSLIHI